jgi:hypothetical protein
MGTSSTVVLTLGSFRGLYIGKYPPGGEISADVIKGKKYENAKNKKGENIKEKGRKGKKKEERGRKRKKGERK